MKYSIYYIFWSQLQYSSNIVMKINRVSHVKLLFLNGKEDSKPIHLKFIIYQSKVFLFLHFFYKICFDSFPLTKIMKRTILWYRIFSWKMSNLILLKITEKWDYWHFMWNIPRGTTKSISYFLNLLCQFTCGSQNQYDRTISTVQIWLSIYMNDSW